MVFGGVAFSSLVLLWERDKVSVTLAKECFPLWIVASVGLRPILFVCTSLVAVGSQIYPLQRMRLPPPPIYFLYFQREILEPQRRDSSN